MVDFATPAPPASPPPLLLPQHAAMLAASGVCADVAAERGYQSITVKARLKELGFSEKQQSVPTLLVPIHGVGGGIALYHHRPDQPRVGKNGKPVKYEFPVGSRMAVDVHPRIRKAVRDPMVPLFITEGVKKADAALSLGLCCMALIGTWNWRGTNERGGKTALPDWESIALKGLRDAPRQVYICYDSDVMHKAEVHQALARLSAFLKKRGASVAYIYLPHGEDGSKVGLDDYLAAGHSMEDLMALATTKLREINDGGDEDGDGDEEKAGDRGSASQKLVALAGGVELFHTERGENYGRFAVGAHLETWPLRSQAFKHWLSRQYHLTSGKPVGSQAIDDALRVLEAKARYDGAECSLSVRCARDASDGSIWIDTGSADWRAINVRPGSWSVVEFAPQVADDGAGAGINTNANGNADASDGGDDSDSDIGLDAAELPEREYEPEPDSESADTEAVSGGGGGLPQPQPQPQPLLFRRHVTQAALPTPNTRTSATEIDLLRPFVNVRSERDWKQLIAWLIAAWVPEIGHPVLVVHGEQGTAKSTLMRLLTMLIDPSHTPLRSEPRDLTAWVQVADHTWLVTLDNVSALPGWLSDAMCRAVTGEAFVKRQLYTDSEDVVMAFRRVVALTGIEVVAQRSDLLDRSILLGLEPIPPDQRRTESEVLAAFDAVRPQIVGSLLTILSGVLAEQPQVGRLTSLPRMADFARVGVAVERVLGWEAGAFLRAYEGSLSAQNEEALSVVPIAEPLLALMSEAEGGEWLGAAGELLQALSARVAESAVKQKEWPQTTKALVSQLKRIAPNLRAAGVKVSHKRSSRQRLIHLVRKVVQQSVTSVTCVTPRSDEAVESDTLGYSSDTSSAPSDTLGGVPEEQVVLSDEESDTYDACDTFLQGLSCEELNEPDEDAYLEAIRR